MKLRTRIVTIAAIPVMVLGAFGLVLSSRQLKNSVVKRTYDGMQATTISVSNLLKVSGEGRYQIKNGQLYKGNDMNLSSINSILDDIKERSGYDVTIFYGDTRSITTITDADGKRQVGTTASDKIVDKVLKNGEDYKDSNIDILGERYIGYYMPLYQDGSK